MHARPTRARRNGSTVEKLIARAIGRTSLIEVLEDRLLLSASVYTWQNANLGAGGFVDGIFYDSHNQNVIYARTDIGGLYKSVNDGTSWSELLDFVGGNTSGSGNGTQSQEIGVLSFAIDPENSNNLFAMVGQYTGTNGDVLYSTNAGATWTATPLSFYVGGNSNGRATGERIAVDPFDSNIVLLGSNSNGLWESTNAGHSFTQLTSLSTSASINFVYFDPYTGTAGSPTQEIFVGENSTAAGTNLFESTNGASTFTEVTGTGSLPNAWMPNRVALASDGNLYLAYSNALAPGGNLTNGGVFRLNTSTGVWANISPDVPQVTNGSGDQFGYVGIALDPNNPDTVVVTSFDRYALGDAIWRTTSANATTPTWTALFDFINYNGFNPTRNTTAAPWDAEFDDGIGNWAGDVTIDPFNSAQIMYGTGQGIWATNNGTSSTTLTAANSWYFPDTGIEFTAVGQVAATTGGTPLYSAMGDIGGFANTTLAFSPAAGSAGTGSTSATDYAGLDPSDAVLIGNGVNTNDGAYTTNGATWTAFSANPGGSTKFTGGSVAMSANGSTIIWTPSGQGPYYSTNNGATWNKTSLIDSITSLTQTGGVPTAVTSSANGFAVGQTVTIAGATPSAYNGTYVIASIVNSTTFTYTDSNVKSTTTSPATGTITASLNGTIIADKVNPNDFYFWTENNNDNAWTLYISTNGGQTFTPSSGGAVGTGNATLAVNPNVAGQLWLSSYIGVYESTNFGASFTHLGSYNTGINSNTFAVGAPAPGSSLPSLYMYGTLASGGFEGIYRSDDGGNTWLLLNSTSQQWGGLVQTISADPNVFGRVYLGINGRGIIMGNPATSLPAGWSDQDINEPGNPGYATSSTTLSNGTTNTEWNITGGGVNISASPITISSLSRTGGVATAVTTTANGLQVGQTVTISGATNSVYDGTFVVTGLYNTTAGLSSGIGSATEFTFAIAAGSDTASGTITATLDDQFNFAYESVTGNQTISAQLNSLTNSDEGNGTPEAGVMFRASTNPTDPFFAFLQRASGGVLVEYRTTAGGSITTDLLNGIPVGSEYLEIVRNGNTFNAMYSADGISWIGIGGIVTIAAMPATANAGLISSAGYNPQLTDAAFSHVNIAVNETFAIQNGSTLNINLSSAGAVSLSESGSTITAGQGSTQVSFTGITTIAVTDTASGDTLNFNGPIALPFTFTNTATSTLNVNSGALTFAAVQGGSINLGTLSIAAGASAAITATTTNSPTTLNLDNLAIAATGTFDVANNVVFINYGSGTDPISQIAALIKSGYNAGSWTGTGIISSVAQTNSNYALGYGDSADPGNPVGLASGTIEIKYTLLGDANLSGVVDGTDFGIVAANFNKGVSGWDQGDFNYDGVVDGTDFGDVAANFNQGDNIAAALPAVSTPSISTTPTTPAPTNIPSKVLHKQPVVKKPKHR